METAMQQMDAITPTTITIIISEKNPDF